MPQYLIRVTRSFDCETVDLEIEADDFEEAKAAAISDAEQNASVYFGPEPEPEFGIDAMDDDEEQCTVTE